MFLTATAVAAAENMSIRADLTEAPRGLIRATLTIPVKPGPLTLVYPQWLPGDHGPTGPIADLTGLKFTASGKTIPWRRDLTDMYAMHLEIPAGITLAQYPSLIIWCERFGVLISPADLSFTSKTR